MKPIRFTKIKDNIHNDLGFEEIIIYDKNVLEVYHFPAVHNADIICHAHDVYHYEYLCIADGLPTIFTEDDLETLMVCYTAKLVEGA